VSEEVVLPLEPEVTASYRDLLERERDEELDHRPQNARHRYWVPDLLDGFEPPEVRAKRFERDRRSLSIINVVNHNPKTIYGNEMNVGTNITVGTNNGQIAENMRGCTNIIGRTPDGAPKELLTTLQRQVSQFIEYLPPEKSDVAAEASDNLKDLVEAATASQPKRRWYSVSATGLIEASKVVSELSGNIAETIGKLGRLLWPDFSLGGKKDVES
jgi:hypothetical protein